MPDIRVVFVTSSLALLWRGFGSVVPAFAALVVHVGSASTK
jgi:hypothetical protein